MRDAAAGVLEALEKSSALSSHAGALYLQRIEQPDADARQASLEALAALGATELAALLPGLVAILEKPRWRSRLGALEALVRLPPTLTAQHASTIALQLRDDRKVLRIAALRALGRCGSAPWRPAQCTPRMCRRP